MCHECHLRTDEGPGRGRSGCRVASTDMAKHSDRLFGDELTGILMCDNTPELK